MNPNENMNDAVYDAKKLGTGRTLVLGVQHLFAGASACGSRMRGSGGDAGGSRYGRL